MQIEFSINVKIVPKIISIYVGKISFGRLLQAHDGLFLRIRKLAHSMVETDVQNLLEDGFQIKAFLETGVQ